MVQGHRSDARPLSATRTKALANIAAKACPHGAGQASYCAQCLQDEERVVALEDTIVELKAHIEEQSNLIDLLTYRADYAEDDIDSIGEAVVRLQDVVGRGYFRAGGPGGKG
jgi:hypothetical protein